MSTTPRPPDAEAILRGDRRALGKGLTCMEAMDDEALRLLDALWERTGRARRVGITGPPGVGKSTLVSGLIRAYRALGRSVGVLAVDPSSTVTGGALLGDRHRLGAEAHDPRVFVRSFGTRGSTGGLSRAAPFALDLLDAAGFDVVLVETAGVGQTEIEVAATADSVAVVLSPESGDAVQAMKAGLLEIADVLCVNKADREGAAGLVEALEATLDLGAPAPWRPPVVATRGLEDATALFEALETHAEWLLEGGRLGERRRRGLGGRLKTLVRELLSERLLAGRDALLDARAAEAASKRRSLLDAARSTVEEILR
ncbi:MAG TPA: methylmalonyl Co-A mutase-associated GTPase MeaB [Planctomycetota bacterium]|nr:methylmalonyl Co-A mutase-associated GTPase MeaB [Planctomycetota bacterium]